MNEREIWNKLREAGLTEIATAAIMGNMKAESAMKANNLQNSYEKKLGYTDEKYTELIDKGIYDRDKFVHDSAGYGLCQWTHWSRKNDLFTFWLQRDFLTSIGDTAMQVDFCIWELKNKYAAVWRDVNEEKMITGATAIILRRYERPADQSDANVKRRSEMAEAFYDAYKGPEEVPSISIPCTNLESIRNKVKMIQETLDKTTLFIDEAIEHLEYVMEDLTE